MDLLKTASNCNIKDEEFANALSKLKEHIANMSDRKLLENIYTLLLIKC